MGKFRQAPSDAPAKRQAKRSSNKATAKKSTTGPDVSENGRVHTAQESETEAPAQKRAWVSIEEVPDEDGQQPETTEDELGGWN
jgi:hypothetical protein